MLEELLELVGSGRADLSIAGYWADRDELVADLREHRDRLRRGDTTRLDLLTALFGPAMPLQDLALASGWGDRFLDLAARFDRACAQQRGPGP